MGLFDKFKRNHPSERSNSEDISKQEVSREKEALDFDDMFKQAFLENEAKFRHQNFTVRRSTNDNPVTLKYIFQELLGLQLDDIGGMTIVGRGEFGKDVECRSIEDSAEVLSFNPFDAILYINDKGERLPRTGQNTTLVISFRPGGKVFGEKETKNDKSILCTDNSIIMFLRGIGMASPTMFIRVSVMIPNFSNPDDFRTTKSRNQPFTTSFVLAYDIEDTTDYQSQYSKIEQSLLEKSRHGDELNKDEQTVLSGITYSKSLGYDFGYGQWLMEQHRFADALMSFQKVFEQLKTAIMSDYDKIHDVFTETCYGLGFCFSELGQFERSVYYLELIQHENNDKYHIEYINSLVNAGNPRALSIVSYHIDQFSENKRMVDSDASAEFYNFLFRRLAYLYIDYKMWDKARSLLERLKDSPENHDFAVSELEYLDTIGH